MKSRRRLARVLFFGVLVAAAFALVVFARRGPRRSLGVPSRTPTGGAALAEDARATLASNDAAAVASIVEDARRYPVRVWSFEHDRYELRIEDAAMTTALDAVLERSGADLVVNGGFFDPEGKPVGLAISEGAVLSRLGKNLSGGVLASDGARAELFAAEGFVLPEGAKFAIQCRPRLVVAGDANVKSDDGKRAERTALCTRDAGRVIDVVIVRGSDDGESPGPSLFALARHLADAGCESALNLDGGPSTGVAWREADGVKLLAPRGPVRHVVAFHERR
ncbi:MAG: phosphodiester glycosidase family protein [Labilithrix sp.]|nr:phosphodiester glycosidase family protein [Labilithrix sp.]